MSYHNNKYGGSTFEAKPRLTIEESGHDVAPVLIDAYDAKSELSEHAGFGNQLQTDSVTFGASSQHTMMACQLAMMTQFQYCVPLDHPNPPRILKFDSRFKSNSVYVQYCSTIKWQKAAGYVHIPCFTRYVMSRLGIVRNAFTGEKITPNKWGQYRLVCDGTTNKLRSWDINLLSMLALAPLPVGFIDYGFGNYSHSLGYEGGVIKWVARPSVKVKNLKSGETEVFPNLEHFKKIALADFDLMKKLNAVAATEYGQRVVTIGEFAICNEEFNPDAPNLDKFDESTVTRTAPAQAPPKVQPQQPVQQTPLQAAFNEPTTEQKVGDPNQLFGDDFDF